MINIKFSFKFIQFESIRRLELKFDLGDLYTRVVNDSYEGMTMMLVPMSNILYGQHKENMNVDYESDEVMDQKFKMSRSLGIISEGNILCWKKSGQWSAFRLFYTFEPFVWYSLLITLLVLTSVKAIHEKKSLSQFSNNFWLFFATSFGHQMFEKQKSIHKNVLYVLWLFCATIMLSAFSGVMLRSFLEPLPDIVIDSWAELFERKDVKITGIQMSFIVNYIEEFDDQEQMAKDFADRFVYLESVGKDWIDGQPFNTNLVQNNPNIIILFRQYKYKIFKTH